MIYTRRLRRCLVRKTLSAFSKLQTLNYSNSMSKSTISLSKFWLTISTPMKYLIEQQLRRPPGDYLNKHVLISERLSTVIICRKVSQMALAHRTYKSYSSKLLSNNNQQALRQVGVNATINGKRNMKRKLCKLSPTLQSNQMLKVVRSLFSNSDLITWSWNNLSN